MYSYSKQLNTFAYIAILVFIYSFKDGLKTRSQECYWAINFQIVEFPRNTVIFRHFSAHFRLFSLVFTGTPGFQAHSCLHLHQLPAHHPQIVQSEQDKGLLRVLLESSIRAKVEHPFRVIKCKFGYR
jgi:hypothetical protein